MVILGNDTYMKNKIGKYDIEWVHMRVGYLAKREDLSEEVIFELR